MILWLTTFAFSIASALLPFLPIEVYILGAGATEAGTAAAISLGIAAGAGATIGKIIWYELARRGAESAWAQKKLSQPKVKASYEKWVARMHGRPWYAAGIMFVAASAGVPPLLAMAAVGGLLKMPMWVFVPTVFLGRSLRFSLLFLGVDFALH
ncbi:VTT domain-containing protein [Nocardioides daeguensis]|uniref:DedA family protein n=1 Tax=Nocardioides daeguensis TaxID=908359 RepID=A0ABP6VNE6_9ACTN|nr:VTT domain-containing protein [Nocardioides daeguensis]MBV6727397.1 VTT domain-containing protein [Nocardioides daeguensis]MCR1775487.1 VTT domain-containing protein [Nocardioides daeguensis]